MTRLKLLHDTWWSPLESVRHNGFRRAQKCSIFAVVDDSTMAAKKNKTYLLLLAVVATENSIRAVTPGGSLPRTRIRGDRKFIRYR